MMNEEELIEISLNHEGEDFLAFVDVDTENVLLNGKRVLTLQNIIIIIF